MLYFYPEKSTKEWPTWKAVWSQGKSAWQNTYPVTLHLEDLFENSASVVFIYVCVRAQSFSYIRLFCDLRDCSPSSSSVHGILQARILEWVTISCFRGSSQPRDGTLLSFFSCIDRQILYHCTTWAVAYYCSIRGHCLWLSTEIEEGSPKWWLFRTLSEPDFQLLDDDFLFTCCVPRHLK